MDTIKIQAMESLLREQTANKDIKTVKLDYIRYLEASLECMARCEALRNDIAVCENKYAAARRVFHTQSREYTASDGFEIKRTFGNKVKHFFANVWVFIVSLFQKIVMVIINLVKSVIVFIQKKRLASKSLQQQMGKQLIGLKDSVDRNKTINTFIRNKLRGIATSTDSDAQIASYEDLHSAINNPRLKKFITGTKVVLNNRKSAFNLDLLEEILANDLKTKMRQRIINQTLSQYDENNIQDLDVDEVEQAVWDAESSVSTDDRFGNLEAEINALYASAILCGEVDNPVKGGVVENMDQVVFEAFGSSQVFGGNKPEEFEIQNGMGSIKTLANVLCLGPNYKKAKMTKVQGYHLLGLDVNELQSNPNLAMNNIKKAYEYYMKDSALVLGSNGYIENINKVLKIYDKVAKEDAKKIKRIKQYIDDQLRVIETSSNHENTKVDYGNGKRVLTTKNNALQGRLHRFTKIMVRVNNMKTHFVALRQYVIANLVAMISSEESIIRTACKASVETEHVDDDKLDEVFNKEYPEYQSDEGLHGIVDKAADKIDSLGLGDKVASVVDIVDKKLDEIGAGMNKIGENLETKFDNFVDKVAPEKKSEDDDDDYDFSYDDDDYSYDDF